MNRFIPFLLSTLTLTLVLQGCLMGESDQEKRIRKDDEAIESYIKEHDISTEVSSSGVHFEVLEENGQGKQVQEDHVAGILYTMEQLGGGETVEIHDDRQHPLRFSYSRDALMPAGLNYEVGRMREGETFRFYIPSYQAFSNYNHGNLFPPHTNFIMEVELVEVKTEEEIYEQEVDSIQSYIEQNSIEAESYPNGLYYVEVEEGTGEIPGDNDLVEFHFTRKYLDGTVIETTEEGDPIQEYLNSNRLVRGLEEGIKLMKEGGQATLIMPSKMAFGKSRQVIPQQVREDWVEEDQIAPLVKPYSSVIYEIELLSVN